MLLNPYIAGNPIGGQTGFFGRDDILREVMQVLRHPESNAIVLYGQRRIGKTSTLLQLERQLTDAADYTPVYFDLQDKADKPLDDVLYELAQRISAVTGQALPDRELFDSQGAYFRDRFVPQAATMETNGGLVLLFDEFDVLDSPKEDQAGAAFFPYLRRWMGETKGTQFVFVIGRRPEDLSIKTISTFKGVRATRVSLLAKGDATAVVRQSEADDSLLWPDEAVKRVWHWAQGHPYFTQLLCSVVWENMYEDEPEETPTATVDDVDAAIDEALKQGANAFAWIWDGLPPAERVVVSAMSEAKEPTITHDDLVNILNQSGVRLIVRQLELAPETLVEWGLLQPTNGGYQFTVLLLRNWVQRNRPLRRTKEELDLLDPQAESLFQTGQRFYQSKQLEIGESQLRLALDTNPNHLKAQLLLGQILFEQEQLDEAITVLEAAYRYDAISARPDLVRALLASASDQDEAAQLKTYQRILKIQPDQPTAKDNILSIHINEASLFEEEGQWAEAVQVYEKLLEKFPDDQRIEKHLQAARTGKREQQIARHMEKASQLEEKEQWAEAVKLYEELLKQFADDERIQDRLQAARLAKQKQQFSTQLEKAKELEKQEKWQEVILVYEKLADEFPDEADWQTWIEEAQAEYDLQQKYNEALGALETGDRTTAQRRLADVIYQRPDYKEAAAYLLQTTNVKSKRPTETPQLKETSESQEPVRKLSAKNPLDYLRLLWWIFMAPQRITAYEKAYGEKAIYAVGKWLASTLTWLPLLLLTVAMGLATMPLIRPPFPVTTYLWISGGLVFVWLLTGWFVGENSWTSGTVSGMALIVAFGVSLTVTIPSVFGADSVIGIVGSVVVSVTLVVVFGVASGVAFGIAGIVTFGMVVGVSIVVVADMVVGVSIGVVAAAYAAEAFDVASVMQTNVRFVVVNVVTYGVVAFGVAVVVASGVAVVVAKGIKSGKTSWLLRSTGGLLVLAYAFLVWFAFFGGAAILARL